MVACLLLLTIPESYNVVVTAIEIKMVRLLQEMCLKDYKVQHSNKNAVDCSVIIVKKKDILSKI